VLYGFGAALCMFGTQWSIGFTILVQLNYAVAPRLGFFPGYISRHIAAQWLFFMRTGSGNLS
jgi:hypothetical protein